MRKKDRQRIPKENASKSSLKKEIKWKSLKMKYKRHNKYQGNSREFNENARAALKSEKKMFENQREPMKTKRKSINIIVNVTQIPKT